MRSVRRRRRSRAAGGRLRSSRIGTSFLFPGVGYGGSCFPKDVKALTKFSSDKKYDFKILKAVDAVNEFQKRVLVKKIEAHFGNSLKGKTIAVWGLAFKPKTDDMREAPAIPIIEALLAKGAKIQAYDPEAMKVAKGIFGNKITYAAKNYDALKGADALAVVTEWQEFREPDFARIKKLMRDAGDLRRPQHLPARADEGAGLHLFLDRTLTWRESSSPAARATSAATPCARSSRPATRWPCSTICRPATPQSLPAGVPLVAGGDSRSRRGASRCSSSIAPTR